MLWPQMKLRVSLLVGLQCWLEFVYFLIEDEKEVVGLIVYWCDVVGCAFVSFQDSGI